MKELSSFVLMSMIYDLVSDIDTYPLAPSFEPDGEAALGERGNRDERVRSIVDYGYRTEDGTKIGVVGAFEFGVIGEGDREGARPWSDG